MEDEMKDISVIMPLYNAEKYLSEALQSVMDQTYEDFELICIDDCSTDRTRDIVEDLQKKDDRVKLLINEEHLGAAPSRNKGLSAAKGEYILFLDGDDVFEEELLEKASGAMEAHQADMVLFEYLHVPSETIHEKKVIERRESFTENYCSVPFAMKDFHPRAFLWWPSSPCNRILRRSFIEKNRLDFQDLPSNNDVYFAHMTLFCAKRIICLDDRRVMVYARDHSEPDRISNNRDPMCTYLAVERLCRELKERDMIRAYAPYLYFRLAAYFIFILTSKKYEAYKKSFYDHLHDQGIRQCIGYGNGYYDQVAAYDRYLLKSFQDHTYESRWFEHRDSFFQVYLREYGDVICEFIKARNSEGKKVILWGIGGEGSDARILLDYLDMHAIKIFGVADRDKRKQGTIVNGYAIQDPSVLYQGADQIIVALDHIYQDICIAVKDTGRAVVDLMEMLKERERKKGS